MDALTREPNALHAAVLRWDIAEIKRLLAEGRNPDAIDRDGMSPLHWAVYGGHLEATKLLLEAGADPNVRCFGATPLCTRRTILG